MKNTLTPIKEHTANRSQAHKTLCDFALLNNNHHVTVFFAQPYTEQRTRYPQHSYPTHCRPTV